VLATQNPIEQEGTYRAARGAGRSLHAEDRRGLSEQGGGGAIVDLAHGDGDREARGADRGEAREIVAHARALDEVYVDDKVKPLHLRPGVRDAQPGRIRPRSELKTFILYGASPRASIALLLALARTRAASSKGAAS
jgi:hypothetical protein